MRLCAPLLNGLEAQLFPSRARPTFLRWSFRCLAGRATAVRAHRAGEPDERARLAATTEAAVQPVRRMDRTPIGPKEVSTQC
jgi:hypothetical protein